MIRPVIIATIIIAFLVGGLTIVYIFQDTFKTPLVNGSTNQGSEFKVYCGQTVETGSSIYRAYYSGDDIFYLNKYFAGSGWQFQTTVKATSFNVPFKLGDIWYTATRYELGAIILKEVPAPTS